MISIWRSLFPKTKKPGTIKLTDTARYQKWEEKGSQDWRTFKKTKK